MKKTLHCTLVLLTCIFLAGCKNDKTDIGLDLIDDLVNTQFIDTISLQAYSVLEDTINTTNLSANILGHLSDPVFGNSEAGIFTQLALAGEAVNFGESPVIDSVVLTLQISGHYGDTNSVVGIRVHQLTAPMSSEEKYYQNSEISFDPTAINTNLSGYTLKPNSTVVVDTGVYNAHIRIRLSQQFGQNLLNHESDLNSGLQSFLPGLYIEAVSHTGNRGYMFTTNMTSALTGLTLYYHNNNEQGKHYTLVCNDKCARFTRITHDYSASQSADFTQEVLQGQRQIGQHVLYLQGGGGVKTRIKFPHLEETFKKFNNRVVIHRAELVVTNVDQTEQWLIQPSNLTIQGLNKNDSSVHFLPDDDYYTNAVYYGGSYDSGTREYRFRVTKYVQQLILGQGDLGNTVNLVVRGNGVRPHRLVLNGTDPASPTRLRLEIAYSTY